MNIFRGKLTRLMAGWVGYWVVLGGMALRRPLGHILDWIFTPPASGSGASASAGYSNGSVTLELLQNGESLWKGSATLLEFSAWVALPPVLMLWWFMRTRTRREAQPLGVLGAGNGPMEPVREREDVGVER